MAKVALAFVLSFMLLLSFTSALGDGLHMRSNVLPGGAGPAGAPAATMSTSSTQNQQPSVASTLMNSSWASWLKHKFTIKFGFNTGNGAPAGGPDAAPAPAPNAA